MLTCKLDEKFKKLCNSHVSKNTSAHEIKGIKDQPNNSTNKKNLVWHSHNFLLPYITVEEYFFQQYFHI